MSDIQEQDPMIALVALDTGFALLLENLKNHSPVIAKSLAIDMQATMQEIPKRLPPNMQGVVDVLEKWSVVLNSNPTQQIAGQSN